MTLEEIKAAVDSGKPVRWSNDAYHVIKDNLGQYLIVCQLNDHCIGLTNMAGDVMNGKEEQFFISE